MTTCNLAGQFTTLVAFGASYLDSGSYSANFVAPQNELIQNPTGVQQAIGRSSNGPTFVEVLADGDLITPGYLNPAGGCTGPLLDTAIWDFAMGGAACDPTVFGAAAPTAPPFSVAQQVQNAIASGAVTSTSLFVLSAATQDISGIVASQNPTQAAQAVAQCFQNQAIALANAGAKNIVLTGIYPFQLAPQNAGASAAQKQNIANLVSTLNANMASVPAAIAAAAPGTNNWFFDMNAFYLNTLIPNAAVFYGAGANAVNMCSTGGMAAGACAANPDSYLWWDVHHPTRETHKFIAQAIYQTLTTPPAV